MRAQSSTEREEWIKILNTLKNYTKQANRIEEISSPLKDSNVERAASSSSQGKRVSLRGSHKNIDSNLLSKICSEKEGMIIVKGVISLVN